MKRHHRLDLSAAIDQSNEAAEPQPVYNFYSAANAYVRNNLSEINRQPITSTEMNNSARSTVDDDLLWGFLGDFDDAQLGSTGLFSSANTPTPSISSLHRSSEPTSATSVVENKGSTGRRPTSMTEEV